MRADQIAGQRTPAVLERIAYDPTEWEAALERWSDASVFHSSAWLSFLAASQGAEPIVAVVKVGSRPVGYFVGAMVHRFGIRILGSPLPGWGAPFMGFVLEDGVDRRAAADALLRFAFRDLKCLHVELADRRLTAKQMAGSAYTVESGTTYLVDLSPTEEDILGRMDPHRRQYIRRSIRRGLRPELASDLRFAEEYFEQLRDVFAHQGLRPTYGVERVRHLIRALQPSGQLLLLRIRGSDGANLATSLVVGRNRTAVAWGAAFFRSASVHHPNELLWWEAMRYWRARGATCLDMNGNGDYGRGDYKTKYGGSIVATARFYRTRSAFLGHGREAVRRFVWARQVIGRGPARFVKAVRRLVSSVSNVNRVQGGED
jgi:Acetyltransferase (GNAT) domain